MDGCCHHPGGAGAHSSTAIHGDVGCRIHISVRFQGPCGSCQSMTCGVKYLESCQLIVWRLQSEILLKVLVFGQIQLKHKSGLI